MERELGCGTAREPDTRGPTGSERSKRPCSQHWYVVEYGGVRAACMRGGPLSPPNGNDISSLIRTCFRLAGYILRTRCSGLWGPEPMSPDQCLVLKSSSLPFGC